MSAQSNLIEKVLVSIAEKLSMKKWRYESKNISGDIVNYVGNLVPVALIDESSDVTINLMIKADSSVLVPEIEIIAGAAYRREVYFYSTLVPLFENNTNISKDYFPKCYYADDSKGSRVIAMQNLAVEGFERHDKGRFLDKEHLILSLESVAKLHSLSLILKAKNIEAPDDLVMKQFSTDNEPQYANGIQKCFKKYGVDMFEGTEHEDFFKNMYSTMTNMTEFMDDCVVNAHTLVYGHGDLWKENFLYKYTRVFDCQRCSNMSAQSVLIEKVLANIAEKLNIKKWRYESENISGDIVNYVGNLVPVTLIDESNDVTIDLMIKAATNVPLPEIGIVTGAAYNREVYFYSTLVPLFENNTNISKDYFPKCYYADDRKGSRVIAMQNLAVEGFKRHDKERFLDKEHLILTLEAVAKLHSLSLILQAKEIDAPDDLAMRPITDEDDDPQYFNGIKKCFKKYGVDMFEGTEHERFFKDLYDYMTILPGNFISDCVRSADALVYGHGDLWEGNFLYKYSDGKPVEVRLLDYQMSHRMCPALDVVFLIMNSTDATVRRAHYKTFVSTYYKTLADSLRSNGIDPENFYYSEMDFHKDIRVVTGMCFSITLFSYALWLGFENLISLLDTTGTVVLEKQKDNVELFRKIIGDLALDADNGLFV